MDPDIIAASSTLQEFGIGSESDTLTGRFPLKSSPFMTFQLPCDQQEGHVSSMPEKVWFDRWTAGGFPDPIPGVPQLQNRLRHR